MISFKMFAGTNIGLRDNNEDNFAVCPNLIKNQWIVPSDLNSLSLDEEGCIMVVADGMGGQNAGEIASAIAIETVQELFSPENLTKEITAKKESIKNFLKKVIIEADIRIKRQSEKDPDTIGMGSTIVISWLIGKSLYIAWLGDSRAYSYVPSKGIGRISKDHSYVQMLVDKGVITEEQAMNHPESNVITRSLGDETQRAKPDVVEHIIENDEIILLCSDGLCGVCSDEEIGSIIDNSQTDLQKCKEDLTQAALRAGGSDNITIALLQLKEEPNDKINNSTENESSRSNVSSKDSKLYLRFLVEILIIICLLLGCIFIFKPSPANTKATSIELKLLTDSLSSDGSIKFSVLPIDAEIKFVYDKAILNVNQGDSTISLIKGREFNKSFDTFVEIISLADSTIRSSAIIHVIVDDGFPIVEITPIVKDVINSTSKEEEIKNLDDSLAKVKTPGKSNKATPSLDPESDSTPTPSPEQKSDSIQHKN